MSSFQRNFAFVTIAAIVLNSRIKTSLAEFQPSCHACDFVSEKAIVDCRTLQINKGPETELLASSTENRCHWKSISDVLLDAVKLHTNKNVFNTSQNPMKLIYIPRFNKNTSKGHREHQENAAKDDLVVPKNACKPVCRLSPIVDKIISEMGKTRRKLMPATIFRHFIMMNSNEPKKTKIGGKRKHT
ncbi:unnamed protein product [Orchesella dallaii]|uniref:Uncharacterized protein n=1 Tax=Orchesella dallaii TaxID=48710 RepID=A0ABP1RGG2_9HEXA